MSGNAMASPLRSLQPTLTLERSSLRIWNVATNEATSVSLRMASERQCRTRRVWWRASGHISRRSRPRTWRRPSARNWNFSVSRRDRVFQNPTSRTSRGELIRAIGLSVEEFRLTTAVCTPISTITRLSHTKQNVLLYIIYDNPAKSLTEQRL